MTRTASPRRRRPSTAITTPGSPACQCHDGNTAGANEFTAAGTVYDKLALANGAQGLSGVTIEITDAKGTKVSVVTASQGAPGNFWTDQPLVFPLQVRASMCPADRPMTRTPRKRGEPRAPAVATARARAATTRT